MASQPKLQRLLHFAQDDDTSGYFPQLARWYDRDKYRMYFGTLNPIAPWLKDYMETQGVECLSCNCRNRRSYPAGIFKLAQLLRQKRIDILHTHLFEPSVIGLTAGTWARTPMRVMTRHYSDYHTRINKQWHVRIDRMCTRLSHAVIPVSEHTRDHMVSEEHAPGDKLHTVLNGIDFDRVRLSSNGAPGKLRETYAPNDAYLVLVVGRMHTEKGYDYLFPAVKELKNRLHRPLKVLIAGTGPMLEKYQQTVRDMDCEDVITFLGFRQDIPDLMVAADLFVLPSVAEAFGLVLAEALYMGTPVVATRVGGIPEIVEDGVHGALVPPANSQALASTVAELLQDSHRRKQMAGAGRDKVVTQFRFDNMVRAYEKIYEQLVAGN